MISVPSSPQGTGLPNGRVLRRGLVHLHAVGAQVATCRMNGSWASLSSKQLHAAQARSPCRPASARGTTTGARRFTTPGCDAVVQVDRPRGSCARCGSRSTPSRPARRPCARHPRGSSRMRGAGHSSRHQGSWRCSLWKYTGMRRPVVARNELSSSNRSGSATGPCGASRERRNSLVIVGIVVIDDRRPDLLLAGGRVPNPADGP